MKPICIIKGCDHIAYRNELCNMHRLRLERHGYLGSPKPIIASHDMTIEQRLFLRRKIKKETGCWILEGTTTRGYGVVWVPFLNKKMYCHRVSANIWLGLPIQSLYLVLHNCPGGDNPKCFNPDHLFIGTHAINSQDMVKKGRSKKGEDRPSSKLTELSVKDIRKKHKDGIGICELARSYNVSSSTISGVCSRRTWKHVL